MGKLGKQSELDALGPTFSRPSPTYPYSNFQPMFNASFFKISSGPLTSLHQLSPNYDPTEIPLTRIPAFSYLTPLMPLSCRKQLQKIDLWHFSSVQFSSSVVSDSLWPHESQHARPPCTSPSPGVHSNSRPSSRWCHVYSSLVTNFLLVKSKKSFI